MLHADSAYCLTASSPWKFAIFGSTTTKVSIYFSSPGPAGPCRFGKSVSFNEREMRILGSSTETNNEERNWMFQNMLTHVIILSGFPTFRGCVSHASGLVFYNTHVMAKKERFAHLVSNPASKDCNLSPLKRSKETRRAWSNLDLKPRDYLDHSIYSVGNGKQIIFTCTAL